LAHQGGKQADDASAPASQPAARTGKDERAERLAAALRENLRRRKAQARGRRAENSDGAGDKPADDTLT
jgi:hypothetical protein